MLYNVAAESDESVCVCVFFPRFIIEKDETKRKNIVQWFMVLNMNR